ncbi:MAG: hypothetical protein ILP14_00965 [Oscillospiraceae bacterium]|nr:hypothetical protein [Oscillospiraceae bacterium]
METELRRKQISLHTLGTGIILFGAWSVVRAMLVLQAKPLAELDLPDDPQIVLFIKILFFLFLGFFLLASFSFRLYIGLSAQAEGTGRKKKSFYLYLTAVILLINILAFFLSLYSLFTNRFGNYNTLDYIVTILVDLTSNILLAQLISTALRVRKLRTLSED